MVCIPDANLIAIADIENNISLYDHNTLNFDKTLTINKLPSVVCCMYYRYIRFILFKFQFNSEYNPLDFRLK